jgi:hypothetical protein
MMQVGHIYKRKCKYWFYAMKLDDHHGLIVFDVMHDNTINVISFKDGTILDVLYTPFDDENRWELIV